MNSQQWQGTLFADYFQFYLWDKEVAPDAPTAWSDEDTSRHLKAHKNVVVVCPVRNMTVPVSVAIHARDPGYDISRWDHVAECSLELPSGKLEVHECTGRSICTFTVEPGAYRVRALFERPDSLDHTGLEGDDAYSVDLWPASIQELKVIKQWSGDHAG
jgi:hypothetical protein